MKKNTQPKKYKTRGDWGAIKPITQVIPNKKKNKKEKYPKKMLDRQSDW